MKNNSISVLRFPRNRSVGWVRIPKVDPDPNNEWKLVGEAIGDISVPFDSPVRLIVDSNAAYDLTWLDLIEPAQLTQLYIVQTNVTDESIQHISHLKRIEVLTASHTYENISDAGTIHLKPLKNLRKLHLNATNIGNKTLFYLKDMQNLEMLSIGATRVTDEGLKHLYSLQSLKNVSFDTSYAGTRRNLVTSDGIALLKIALPNCDIEI